MAAGRHNLTRRALLGVAFAAPVILGDCTDHPAAAAPDPTTMARQWDRALAVLERVREAECAADDLGDQLGLDRRN